MSTPSYVYLLTELQKSVNFNLNICSSTVVVGEQITAAAVCVIVDKVLWKSRQSSGEMRKWRRERNQPFLRGRLCHIKTKYVRFTRINIGIGPISKLG